MNKKIINRIQGIYQKGDSFSPVDWILFGCIALFCFISFSHSDIMYTGNRSWILYDGILDFYDNVAAWTGDNGANYMPSTFFLYGIWNLPLKLFGVSAPETIWDFRSGLCIWYKLLPFLFFIGSLYLLYLVAKQMGLGQHKSKLVLYAFATMPVCFYSQFIFSQYDIFTVFFMLWGMYYYYRNEKHDMVRFSLLFGLAITFKYYAVLIFAVFLLIREKRVRYILLHGIYAVLPFVLEFIPYRTSAGFQKGVLGFGALHYASNEDFANTFSSLSYTKMGCAFLLIWAYFIYAKNRKEEVAWTLYFSCGMCFALFGFSAWHPQWLMFLAPFFVLSAFINKHLDKFLWMDAALVVVLHFYSVLAYMESVDVSMMRFLIWKNVFDTDQPWFFMGDVLPKISTNTTNSIFVAALLIYFVMKHPKFTLEDYSERGQRDYMHLIRFRLLLLMVIFCFTSFAAAYVNTVTPQVFVGKNSEDSQRIPLKKGTVVEQVLPEMEGTLERIGFYSSWIGNSEKSKITIEILDEAGKVLYETTMLPREICDKGYTEHILDAPLSVSKKKEYTIRFYSENGKDKNCIAFEIAKGADLEGTLSCTVDGASIKGIADIYYMLKCPDWNTAKKYMK